ncbi:plant basic secretory protein [Aureobasidium sp. EXF-10727]|nr:plant basic secretory protein [Aureobasidium sp. EXF-10727]
MAKRTDSATVYPNELLPRQKSWSKSSSGAPTHDTNEKQPLSRRHTTQSFKSIEVRKILQPDNSTWLECCIGGSSTSQGRETSFTCKMMPTSGSDADELTVFNIERCCRRIIEDLSAHRDESDHHICRCNFEYIRTREQGKPGICENGSRYFAKLVWKAGAASYAEWKRHRKSQPYWSREVTFPSGKKWLQCGVNRNSNPEAEPDCIITCKKAFTAANGQKRARKSCKKAAANLASHLKPTRACACDFESLANGQECVSETTPYFQTMSPVPPEPTPSQAPPSLETPTNEAPPEPTTTSGFPKVKLRLELRDLTHPSTDLFLKNFNSAKDFADLVDTVLKRLYTIPHHDDATTSLPRPTHPKIPPTRSVTLILRDMDGVAYTTGADIDDDHKEIHLSLGYLKHVATQKAGYSARTEILGVVCHELVHCFQWNARGTCNGGFIEGIADWVRLNAGFIPPHWKKEAGKSWDTGYQNTGYFLDWIEKTKDTGSVYVMNQALVHKKYDNETYWKDLFGQSVESLWKEYAESLKKPKEESESYGEPNLKMQIRIKKDVEG